MNFLDCVRSLWKINFRVYLNFEHKFYILSIVASINYKLSSLHMFSIENKINEPRWFVDVRTI